MAMSKQDFIALADCIRDYNDQAFDAGSNIVSPIKFEHTHLLALAEFCKGQNSNFMRERWMGYVTGSNGPNGGSIKKGAR